MNQKLISSIRQSHLGRQLHELDKYFKINTLKYIQQNGYPSLTYGQLSLLIHLKTSEATPTKHLIESLGVTKQAVSKMLIQCEELKLIKRVPSKEDGRTQDILIGSTGMKVLKVGIKSVAHVENEILRTVGDRNFDQLKKALSFTNFKLGIGPK